MTEEEDFGSIASNIFLSCILNQCAALHIMDKDLPVPVGDSKTPTDELSIHSYIFSIEVHNCVPSHLINIHRISRILKTCEFILNVLTPSNHQK